MNGTFTTFGGSRGHGFGRLGLFVVLMAGGAAFFATPAMAVAAAQIYLDADTPATGSLLATTPLLTPYGTITFQGQIRDRDGDPEFDAAGALGNVFNIPGDGLPAQLSFDFPVVSATFIYGGNMGSFLIEARDAFGGVVSSFYQANTYTGQPAGPVTLTGAGIRSLWWHDDPGMTFCAMDNISINVPEPATMSLLALGGLLLVRRRRA